jgi:hypothetical protein
LNHFIICDFCDGSERSDAQSAFLCQSNPPQVVELGETDKFFGVKDIVPKTAKEICAACMDPGTIGR